jgi:hypothetical protein
MSNVQLILKRQKPESIVFAPNYWQWFSHHRNHNTLPKELKYCKTQLDVINHLGLDVFSRNIYCDEQHCWFGGLCQEHYKNIEVVVNEYRQGRDKVIEKIYLTSKGTLSEKLRYVYDESTLIQEKFLVDDYRSQLNILEDFVKYREWRFLPERYYEYKEKVGDKGIVVAELFSPLKMLHMTLGPVNTTYLLMDYSDRIRDLLKLHEQAQLDLVKQMVQAGVSAMMSMDNLDTMFHPPFYVENYSASFYEKASRICHEHNSTFFIHACGHQKANLKLISSLGVDGLEGVAYPPLGDMQLDAAMELTNDNFILTGGISAIEIQNLQTEKQIYIYVKNLFARMRPYAHRFIFSASCNTPINTNWETIKIFRDAWLNYSEI